MRELTTREYNYLRIRKIDKQQPLLDLYNVKHPDKPIPWHKVTLGIVGGKYPLRVLRTIIYWEELPIHIQEEIETQEAPETEVLRRGML